MSTAGRAGVVAAALVAALIPLLVIPAVRAREDEPARPGRFALCPLENPGGGSFFFPAPALEEALRQEALRQPVPDDGGVSTFSGRGSGTGRGPAVGPGPGTGLPGTTFRPGDEFEPTPPTIPPEVVAEEVVEEDDPDDRSSFPWPILLLVLLAAALGAMALARRQLPASGDATAAAAAATDPARRRRRRAQPQDDLEARVREAFVQGLHALDHHGVVPYEEAEAQPSSRIARRLDRGAPRQAFTSASTTFDEVVYGRRPATREDVAAIERAFADVVQPMQRMQPMQPAQP